MKNNQLETLKELSASCEEGEELAIGIFNKTNNKESSPDAIWAGKRYERKNDAGLVIKTGFKSVHTLLYLPGEMTGAQRNMLGTLAKAWAEKSDAGFVGVCKPTKSHVFFRGPQETERSDELRLVDFLLSLIKDSTWEKQVLILTSALEKLLDKPDYETLLMPRNGDMLGYMNSLRRVQKVTEDGTKVIRSMDRKRSSSAT